MVYNTYMDLNIIDEDKKMSRMKEFAQRLDEVGSKINTLDLKVGKRVKIVKDKLVYEVIEIHNTDKDYTNMFAMSGITVRQVNGFVEKTLVFDSAELRANNELGKDLPLIAKIL